mmetsp:Transcript_46401/g.119745  ORF Transcript_46401/g.119745 Transcript_46401/m.119745 type:complete len:100 (-) Transcript_46401:102-401(-)
MGRSGGWEVGGGGCLSAFWVLVANIIHSFIADVTAPRNASEYYYSTVFSPILQLSLISTYFSPLSPFPLLSSLSILNIYVFTPLRHPLLPFAIVHASPV